MPEIRMLRQDGRNCPIIKCDVCKKTITNAGRAVVVWPEVKVEGQDRMTAYAHKGACHDAIDAVWGKPNRPCPWDELSMHMCRLMFNLGMGSSLADNAKESLDFLHCL